MNNMQNLSKWYCRNLFLSRKYMSSMINKEFKAVTNTHKQVLKLWKASKKEELFNTSSYNVLHKFLRECRAIYILLSPDRQQQKNINEMFHRVYASSRSKNNQSKNNDSAEKPSHSDHGPGGENEYIAALLKISFIVMTVFAIIFNSSVKNTQMGFISWNEFVHQMLAKGEVQQLTVSPEIDFVTVILHPGAIVNGKPSPTRYYQLFVADTNRLEEKIREVENTLGIKSGDSIPIIYARRSNIASIVSSVALLLIIFFIFNTVKKSSIFPKDLFGGITRAKFTLIDPLISEGRDVRFKDVAGLKEAKIEVMEFVDYLKRPEHYKTLGAKVPKGALLLGPPGCGKTMLAKAVATEAGVPFLSMNGSEFIEMIGGLGAARVRDLFKEARKRSPSILYIDEIDAIGKKRSGAGGGSAETSTGSNSESEQTLNQLLVEMDGMASRDGVIVLASTNRDEVLDRALLRPGRFDRHILIDLPTLSERKEIFERHLQNIVLEKKPENYSARLAQLTPGFSGADIANICNEAALHAARVKKKYVDVDDLAYAIDRVLCGTEKKSHGVSPTEKRIVAYHEAGHALVAWLLEHTDALLKVTIKPTTRGALGFSQYTPSDRQNFSKEQLFDIMCTLLGGRAAENIIFNQVTTGAQDDLQKVTKAAYATIQQFGMSENVGHISFSAEETGTHTRKPYSRKLANLMDAEARQIVANAYLAAQKLLTDHRDKLVLVAEALLKQETLTYEEVEKLIGPPPFGQKKKVDFIDILLPTTDTSPPVEDKTIPTSIEQSQSL